jgi:hypothetical protein
MTLGMLALVGMHRSRYRSSTGHRRREGTRVDEPRLHCQPLQHLQRAYLCHGGRKRWHGHDGVWWHCGKHKAQGASRLLFAARSAQRPRQHMPAVQTPLTSISAPLNQLLSQQRQALLNCAGAAMWTHQRHAMPVSTLPTHSPVNLNYATRSGAVATLALGGCRARQRDAAALKPILPAARTPDVPTSCSSYPAAPCLPQRTAVQPPQQAQARFTCHLGSDTGKPAPQVNNCKVRKSTESDLAAGHGVGRPSHFNGPCTWPWGCICLRCLQQDLLALQLY